MLPINKSRPGQPFENGDVIELKQSGAVVSKTYHKPEIAVDNSKLRYTPTAFILELSDQEFSAIRNTDFFARASIVGVDFNRPQDFGLFMALNNSVIAGPRKTELIG